MPLTPQDVHDKVFTPTRFKPGYDENEVDAFLDEVEAELGRLLTENTALSERASKSQDGPSLEKLPTPFYDEPAAQPPASAAPDPEIVQRAVDVALADAARAAEQTRADALAEAARLHEQAMEAACALAREEGAAAERSKAPTTTAAPVVTSPEQDPRVVELTESLQRTLILAQRTADDVVAQAHEQARLEAERAAEATAAAQVEAERVLADARQHAAELTAAAEAERAAVLGAAHEQASAALADLTGRQEGARDTISRLAAFEQEHRGRLDAFLRKQLNDLSSLEPVPAAPADEVKTSSDGAES